MPSDAGDASGGTASHEESDRSLVSRAQQGDQQAFGELVTRHRGKVYAMIVNMVKNDADAWDLAQDTFLKVWRALPKFQNRAKFTTWLFRITHNVVYDWMRKRKIESAGELDDQLLSASDIEQSAPTSPSLTQQPDEALESLEVQEKIKEAIRSLSPAQQEVILLREVQGMEYKEIAEICGCSPGTVMSRLFYARKQLKILLKDERSE